MTSMKISSKKILKTVETKGFATLLTGNIMVSFISLVFYPVLTRLYSPGEFGVFASFMVVMAFTSIISSLQLHAFLPIPSSKDEAKHLFQNSLGLLTLSTAFLVVAVSSIYFLDLKIIVKGYDIKGILFFLPIYSFLVGLNEIFKANNIRNKHFYINAKATNVNRVFANLIKVALSFSLKSVGLVLGDIAGLMLSAGIYKRNSSADLTRPRIDFSFIKKYFKRGIFSTYSATLNQLIIDLPMVFVGAMFSIELMGAFLVSYKIILQPSLILGSSLAGAVFRKMNEVDAVTGALRRYFFRVTKKVMLLLLPVCLLSALIAEDVAVWLLGKSWESSGNFAKYFVLLVPFKVLSALTYNLFLTIDKVQYLALKKTFNIVLVVSVFMLAEGLDNILTFLVGGEVLISVIFYFFGLAWTAKKND
ncbi:MAG: hypothetical protein CME64_03995 [Halobacteriovoraceae bacterium]|nr:hypothetical protein [Halobacteriovoraceae bacterium]|tara:strand:- start:77813 stop:79069 length:1257 start_codon:yes stop_codon:yes gene_type:complete